MHAWELLMLLCSPFDLVLSSFGTFAPICQGWGVSLALSCLVRPISKLLCNNENTIYGISGLHCWLIVKLGFKGILRAGLLGYFIIKMSRSISTLFSHEKMVCPSSLPWLSSPPLPLLRVSCCFPEWNVNASPQLMIIARRFTDFIGQNFLIISAIIFQTMWKKEKSEKKSS